MPEKPTYSHGRNHGGTVEYEQPPENLPLLTHDEVRGLLGVSRTTLWRMRLEGRLPEPIRVAGQLRWRRDALRDWIGWNCRRVNPELAMAFRAVQLRAKLDCSDAEFPVVRFAAALRRVAETFDAPAEAMAALIALLSDPPTDA